MHPLEVEVQALAEQYQLGNLSAEERNYLLQEIRDIRAAQECASDEQLCRYIVQACNLAMAVV
jgi:anti-sigma-K factor RskA